MSIFFKKTKKYNINKDTNVEHDINLLERKLNIFYRTAKSYLTLSCLITLVCSIIKCILLHVLHLGKIQAPLIIYFIICSAIVSLSAYLMIVPVTRWRLNKLKCNNKK